MLISAKIKDIYEGSKSTYNDQVLKEAKIWYGWWKTYT